MLALPCVIAVLINALFFFAGIVIIELPLGKISAYDLILLAIAALLIVIFLASTFNRARELALLEQRKD